MSERSPSLQWFAPDFLIGPSLPFERRATRVARQPQEQQMGAGLAHGGRQEPSWPRGLPAAPALPANAFPFFFFSSSWDSLGPHLQELLVPDLFGFAPALVPFFFFSFLGRALTYS